MNTGRTERGGSDNPQNFYNKIPGGVIIIYVRSNINNENKLKHNLDKDVYVRFLSFNYFDNLQQGTRKYLLEP